jgi:hypothetical protein
MMSGLSMVGSHVYYAVTHVLDSDQLENVHVNKSEIMSIGMHHMGYASHLSKMQ